MIKAFTGLNVETPFGPIVYRPIDHQSTMGAYVGQLAKKNNRGVMVNWRYVGGANAHVLPVPMLNVINGGEHANNAIDVQEFMIVPHGFETFSEGLHAAVRTFHQLKRDIDARGLSTAVGDEGGFAPDLGSNVEALDLLVEAIGRAGYAPGTQISIALDVAATELFRDGGTVWLARGEGRPVRGAAMPHNAGTGRSADCRRAAGRRWTAHVSQHLHR